MRWIARLVAWVRRFLRAVARRHREQKIFFVDELIARVVRHRVDAGVHADRVARTGLDAEATEDAPELVDDELHGEALVAATLRAFRILSRLDVDALRGTRRRTTETRNAARASIIARRQPMHASEALRVRTPLLGVADRRDAV